MPAGRLSGTVSPFRAEQGTSLETPSPPKLTEPLCNLAQSPLIATNKLPALSPLAPRPQPSKCGLVPVCPAERWYPCPALPGPGTPTPVLLPGESHGQRSLAGYSPWGHKRVTSVMSNSV